MLAGLSFLAAFIRLNWFSFSPLCFPRAKYAVGAIKKKVNDKNPHVALYALEVSRSIMTLPRD